MRRKGRKNRRFVLHAIFCKACASEKGAAQAGCWQMPGRVYRNFSEYGIELDSGLQFNRSGRQGAQGETVIPGQRPTVRAVGQQGIRRSMERVAVPELLPAVPPWRQP